jgi:hypothetical protein
MERYFFHIRVCGQLVPDEEGMDLPHLDAALAELSASARDLSATSRDGTIEMTTAQGKILTRMNVRAALH